MRPLFALFSLTNLMLGTAAFVLSGILQAVADGLNVSVPAAGQGMTVYALATAVLAPLVLMATGSWPRKRVLLAALVLFTAGCAICAWAPNLTVLLIGRAVMGTGAVFTPVAAGITITIAEPARRGQALAFVFLGMSLSYVIGLPLASWLGLNFGFRSALWAVTGASAVAGLLLWAFVPRRIEAPGAAFAGFGAVLMRGDVLAVLGLTLLQFSAIFVVFSYIGPVLQELVPMSGERLSATLALFGVSGVIGTLAGGAANDRFGSVPTLRAQLLLLGTMMALLPLTAGHWPWMMAVMMLWGTAGFGMMAPQQTRLAALAPRDAPLLLSLNSSMLYIGTAVGAAIGGALLPGLGFAKLSWVGVVVVALAFGLLEAGKVLTGRGDTGSRLAPERPPRA